MINLLLLLTCHNNHFFVLSIMTVKFPKTLTHSHNPIKIILVVAQVQPKYYKRYTLFKYLSKVKTKMSK